MCREPFGRERRRLPAVEDHLDNVRRQEGEGEGPAHVRDLLAIACGDFGNGRSAAGAKIVEPAMCVGDQSDQIGVGRAGLGRDLAEDHPNLLSATQDIGRQCDLKQFIGKQEGARNIVLKAWEGRDEVRPVESDHDVLLGDLDAPDQRRMAAAAMQSSPPLSCEEMDSANSAAASIRLFTRRGCAP